MCGECGCYRFIGSIKHRQQLLSRVLCAMYTPVPVSAPPACPSILPAWLPAWRAVISAIVHTCVCAYVRDLAAAAVYMQAYYTVKPHLHMALQVSYGACLCHDVHARLVLIQTQLGEGVVEMQASVSVCSMPGLKYGRGKT